MIRSDLELLKVLPVLVCRKEQVHEGFLNEKLEQLRESLRIDVQILKGVDVYEEKDVQLLNEYAAKADVVLLYKPHLGLGSCVVKISEFNLPMVLFSDEGLVNNPLDALEYIYPREKVWVAVDYEDLDTYLMALSAKKKLAQTKMLILNADYPHWERFLCRVHGGSEAIKEKLGIELEYVKSEEVIERWKKVGAERVRPLVENWMKGAERIVEPGEEDVVSVAKLYFVMKDLLEEKNAKAVTMAYGENPLPVPCFAYTNLRDEGVPSACEADIISLLSMVMLNYVAQKPCFMGNTFVDATDGTLIITHCVCPRRMEGYKTNPEPYTFRRYHKHKFVGSLTAYVKMDVGREVTICRLSGDLKSMLMARGTIVDCVDSDAEEYCRVKAKVKIDDPKELVHRASGNHHVMVYGDCRNPLKILNETLGITTIEV
jgi:L-fucose isomerase-like protein